MLNRIAMGVVALAAAAGSCSAQFSVNIGFEALAGMYAPDWSHPYGMYTGVQVTGFSNPTHPDNYATIFSPVNEFGHSHFSAEQFPSTGYGGSSSILDPTIAGLVSLINQPGDWTLRIVDGASGVTHEFTFEVSTPGIPAEYLRPITLSVAPGDTIDPSETFTWSMADPINPIAEYNNAYGLIFGDNPSTFEYIPLAASDRQWTPSSPLQPNLYNFTVYTYNNTPDQSLVQPTHPQPVGATPALDTFTFTVQMTSFAQSGELLVPGGAVCGTSDFDGDGDSGTDFDIEAFFACLAGDCCPTCYSGGSDFNADGDYGTDADIESFFRVLAGGPC